MYKLGIIGGMGPLATNELYKRIIERTPATCDSEHINTVILSHATLPDRTESILTGNKENFLNAIKGDFDIMNRIRPDKIAIPCNTSHYFYEDFTKFTDIKIVNMVEETIIEAKNRGFSSAYVFGTKGTYTAKVYEKYATKHRVEIKYIEDDEKDDIMKLIYSIKEGEEINPDAFNHIISKYVSKDAIGIIACTELSLIKLSDENNKYCVDALDVLTNRAI